MYKYFAFEKLGELMVQIVFGKGINLGIGLDKALTLVIMGGQVQDVHHLSKSDCMVCVL